MTISLPSTVSVEPAAISMVTVAWFAAGAAAWWCWIMTGATTYPPQHPPQQLL